MVEYLSSQATTTTSTPVKEKIVKEIESWQNTSPVCQQVQEDELISVVKHRSVLCFPLTVEHCSNSVGNSVQVCDQKVEKTFDKESGSRNCTNESYAPELTAIVNQSKGEEVEPQTRGFQLRALSDRSAAPDEITFQEPTSLVSDRLNVESFSSELVTETLNYFVNCRQRLSQMTKTFDDSDAYILLLQEKEVDLELAARIGQDLLKQNGQLKDAIRNLESELARRQDDVQQLRHELASNKSLLDTFIEEEEEQQNKSGNYGGSNRDYSRTTTQDDSDDQFPSSSTSLFHMKASAARCISTQRDHYDDDQSQTHRGFLSLTPHKPCGSSIDPFTSLPYHVNTQNFNTNNEQQNPAPTTSSSPTNLDTQSKPAERLVESVTLQLVESNKRLCELQDELLFKSEQSLLQQEKIFRLEQQVRESDKRLNDVSSENETLRKRVLESTEAQHELSEELKICKRNFFDLLHVYLELQKEFRLNKELQLENSLVSTDFAGEPNESLDTVNNSSLLHCDSMAAKPASSSLQEEMRECLANIGERSIGFGDKHLGAEEGDDEEEEEEEGPAAAEARAATAGREQLQPQQQVSPSSTSAPKSQPVGRSPKHRRSAQAAAAAAPSTSQRKSHTNLCSCSSDLHSDSDGADSGLHTTNLSNLGTPHGLNTDTEESDDFLLGAPSGLAPPPPVPTTDSDTSAGAKQTEQAESKSWLGFSSFMISTLLLICLSVGFTSTSNCSLAPKLQQIKLER